MTLLDVKEEKWYRKAIEGFRKKWVSVIKEATTYEAWVRGIATVTGLDEATVRASFPAQEYRKFQQNPEAYLEIAVAKIENAFRNKKWSRNYRKAFGG